MILSCLKSRPGKLQALLQARRLFSLFLLSAANHDFLPLSSLVGRSLSRQLASGLADSNFRAVLLSLSCLRWLSQILHRQEKESKEGGRGGRKWRRHCPYWAWAWDRVQRGFWQHPLALLTCKQQHHTGMITGCLDDHSRIPARPSRRLWLSCLFFVAGQ